MNMFDVFNAEFERQLPKSKSYRDAFHAAEERFISLVGQSPYKSYESFKVQRSKQRAKRRN